MRKFPSKIKAIETKYNGYKFRSRLEARYAVFFDSLGIQYYYEHEGYSLEGLAYLPDFYLPQHNCFIEIKGQEPTQEEFEKAILLALYTGKDAYVFTGNIGIPQDEGECNSYSFYAPELWKYPSTESRGGSQTTKITTIAPDILGLVQRAENLNLSLSLDDNQQIIFTSEGMTWDMKGLSWHITLEKQRHRFLETFQLTIKGREHELHQVFQAEEGWIHELMDGDENFNDHWYECSHCNALLIGFNANRFHPCRKQSHAQISDKSPRLMAAYEAARQARF